MKNLLALLILTCLPVTHISANSYIQRYNCPKMASAMWGDVTINAWADAEVVFNQFFSRVTAKGVTLDDNSPLFNFRLSNSSPGAYIISNGLQLKIFYSGVLNVYFANGVWYDDQALDFSCEFVV